MKKDIDIDIDVWEIDWEENRRKSLEEERKLNEIKKKAERYELLMTILCTIGFILTVIALGLVEYYL